MKANVILPTIRQLYGLLPRKHKTYWGLLILLSIGFSLVETIGVSAIMPFISMATTPEVLDSDFYKRLFDFFGIQQTEMFIIYFGIAIIAFYVFRAIYSIIHTYFIILFSNTLAKYFSTTLFKVNLSLPYTAYVQKNSGELLKLTNTETIRVSYITMNILRLITEFFTIAMVYSVLVILNWRVTLILTLVLAFFLFVFLKILVKKNISLGKKRVEADIESFRLMQEAFRNFKFVRLMGNKNELADNYNTARQKSVKALVTSGTLNAMPKNILESIGFSLLIATIIFALVRYGDAAILLPIISMYAIALYRILPSMLRLIGNINGIASAQYYFNRISEMISQPTENEGNEPIAFNATINLHNVSFNYATGGEVLRTVSLIIRKGEKIAVTGESGGGKSTLIDIIIGILKPCSGEIAIDSIPLCEQTIRSWRRKIGYIPQSIYLFDGTVAENVAYGSVIDEERIEASLRKANIWDFLLTKEGINTKVGEGGIQLSGGQQQRIGIARAMYNNPEILVLDEATSSLDNETEKKIMDEIYLASENKTLIVIAHRLSTVERCDRTIIIKNGEIAGEYGYTSSRK